MGHTLHSQILASLPGIHFKRLFHHPETHDPLVIGVEEEGQSIEKYGDPAHNRYGLIVEVEQTPDGQLLGAVPTHDGVIGDLGSLHVADQVELQLVGLGRQRVQLDLWSLRVQLSQIQLTLGRDVGLFQLGQGLVGLFVLIDQRAADFVPRK